MEIDREKLFLDNQKLAYFTLHRYFKTLADDEDFQQEALVGLWRACKAFDPERGCMFSTLACQCIRNAVLYELRQRKRHEVSGDFSLDDAPPTIASDNTCATLADIIEDPHAQDAHEVLDGKQYLQGLPEDERAILEMRMQGMSQAQIAEITNQSQGNLSKRLKRIRAGYEKATREAE